MLAKKLKSYLESKQVKYHCISHSPAFTAQEVAASAHVSGKHLAKIIMIKVNGRLAMFVLPAQDTINFPELSEALGAKQVDLARESEFKDQFPDCEVGAMPPFGPLYGLPVYVSNHLNPLNPVLFNAGSHSELMELSYPDFERLANPKVLALH